MQRIRACLVLACGLAAWLCCAAPSRAEGVAVQKATKQQAQAAGKAFRAADELFDVQRYVEAIEKYGESYDIVASPNTRLMIARSLRELGRLDEAYAEYQAAVAEAERLAKKRPEYESTAQAARAELQALRSRVAFLKVDLGDVPPESRITVAGREVSAAALEEPQVVIPGEVVVLAKAPDGREAAAQVRVAAGREKSVELKLGEKPTPSPPAAEPEEMATPTPEPEPAADRPAESKPPLKTYAYVAGGVGVAGMLTYAVFGALNNSKFSDLESECSNGHCPPEREDDIKAGRRYQKVSVAGLVVGVVGLGAGATLFYLGHRQESASQAAVYLGPGSLYLRGRF